MTLLALAWLRSRPARRSSVIVVLAFAIVAMVVICVSAFTPTSEQLAEKEFGVYEASTYTSVDVGDLGSGDTARVQSEVDAAVPGAHVMIETDVLRPDSLTKRFVQAPLDVLRFVEDPGLLESFPGRYTLEDGVWPEAPGEVVVSPHLLDSLPARSEFTVLSGRVTFEVVGVVEDAYARQDDTIVAAPGTWESIPPAEEGLASQPTEATMRILFDDPEGTVVTRISKAVTDALPPLPKAQGSRSGYVTDNLLTRRQLARMPDATFGSDQLVVSYLPLLLVVLLVSALVVGQTRAPHRARADRLVGIGVRRSLASTSQLLVLTATMALSIVAGLAIGWLAALALRAMVLPNYADQPLSPVPGLDRTAVAIAALCLVLIVGGTLWPRRSSDTSRWSVVSSYVAELHLGLIRRVAVVLLIVGALRVGGGVTSVLAAYLAVAALILITPDVLRVLVWALPSGSPRAWVAQRLMQGDMLRQALACVVIACCIALPVLVGTQLASQKASDASFAFSRIPAHQIWVQSDSDMGDVAGAAQAVEQVPGIGSPVALRTLRSNDGVSAAFFAKSPNSGRASLNIMVVDTADQVRRVIGDDLPADAEAVLNAGGVLDFTSATGDQKFAVYSTRSKPDLTTPALPTLRVPSLSIQIQANFGGAVLRDTAQELGLPVSVPKRYVFPDVSQPIIAEAAQTAVEAGYDSDFVQYAVEPPPPDLPTYAYVFLAALLLGGLAILLSVIRGQGQRLRGYLARMVAIGLGTRWPLSILGIQASLVVVVGLVVGVSAGVLGVRVTSENYAVTSIPLVPIVLAGSATIMAAALASASAVRALTAVEDPEIT